MAAAAHDPARPQTVTDVPFRSHDGTQLFGRLHRCHRPRGNALVVHGYLEHGGRYGEVCSTLCEAGLNAFHYDMRGHGRAGGARGLVRTFTDYLEDLDAALAQLEDLAGDRPLLLVGHSNGGLIVLRLLADPFRQPTSLRAAVLSSPFLGLRLPVSPLKRAAAHIASRAMPRLALPETLRVETLTSDPDKQRERLLDTLCHDAVSARWHTEAQKTQAWVAEFAHRITVPTLWLVSGKDEIADPRVSRALQSRLRAPATYREFPDMHHEVFNERERTRVFEHLRRFLETDFFK